MGRKRHDPEEIVSTLRQVDVLKTGPVKRLTDLGEEDERVRKAVSDLAPEKLILGEAASGTEGPRPRNV